MGPKQMGTEMIMITAFHISFKQICPKPCSSLPALLFPLRTATPWVPCSCRRAPFFLSDAVMAHHFLSITTANTLVLSLITSYSSLPVFFLDFPPYLNHLEVYLLAWSMLLVMISLMVSILFCLLGTYLSYWGIVQYCVSFKDRDLIVTFCSLTLWSGVAQSWYSVKIG